MRALAYTKPRRSSITIEADFEISMRQWERDVKAAARAAHNTNATFNYDRFYSGVGLNEEKSPS